MARCGVEGIRYVGHARAAGVTTSADLTYTFNGANGFDSKLRSAGHARAFYWANTDCWESDIRDTDQGGDDRHWTVLHEYAITHSLFLPQDGLT